MPEDLTVGRVAAHEDDALWVQIHGERWQARTTAALAPGDRVRVVAVEDLCLRVEPLPDTTATNEAASWLDPMRAAGLACWAFASALAPFALEASALWIVLGVPAGALLLLMAFAVVDWLEI